jgi:predicted Zn-dependent peptidase
LLDDPDRLNRTVERIRGVQTEDVRSFAATFLGPDNRAVVSYVPKDEA